MPFSAQLGTPLSNFEANLNYKEVDDPSLTVKFDLVDEPNTSLLIWTTTPWTLPSNLAVMAKKRWSMSKSKSEIRDIAISSRLRDCLFISKIQKNMKSSPPRQEKPWQASAISRSFPILLPRLSKKHFA